ncbi:MAG: hypothetical protein Q9166_000194 [cf. Caloplaca sp. 2 TL-2023]
MSTNERDSIARTFSTDLDAVFSMDTNLDGLVQSVEQKKQAVSSQSQELEALEARLRETEEKLKEKQTIPAGKKINYTGQQQQTLSSSSVTETKGNHAASNMETSDRAVENIASQAPSASTMSYWRPQMPGTLPETPSDSRQNSYLSERRDA